VPPGAIKDEHGVGSRFDLRRDFVEMPLHCLGVAARQDEARADTAFGADSAENPS